MESLYQASCLFNLKEKNNDTVQSKIIKKIILIWWLEK